MESLISIFFSGTAAKKPCQGISLTRTSCLLLRLEGKTMADECSNPAAEKSTFSGDALKSCGSTTNLSPATGIQMSLEMSIRSRRNRTTRRRSYRAYPGSCCVMLAHRFVLGMTKMYDDILSVQWFSSLFSFCNQELKKIKRQKELARKRGDVPWMEAKRLMGKSMGKSLRWVPHPRV